MTPLADLSIRMLSIVFVAAVLAGAPARQDGLDLTQPPRLDQVPTELDALGPRFEVRSLWRSERGLGLFSHDALRICEAVALAALEGAEGEPWPAGQDRFTLGLAESPRALRERDGEAPPHSFFSPSVRDDEARLPAVAMTPALEDRTLFGTGLPAPVRRQVALLAGDATAARLGLTGAARVAEALRLAQAGLELTGGAWSLEEDPWCSTGLAGLRGLLEAVDSASEGAARLEALAARARPRTAAHRGLAPGVADAATAEEVAALLLRRSGGDRGAALLEALRLEPRWVVEAGGFGRHPYGWQTSAPRRRDTLMLSAAPVGAESYVIETEFFSLPNDRRFPPQADVVFGDEDGDRFLLACSSFEGIYLFRREGPDADYEALAERKESVVPVGQRIPVRIDVRAGVINVTVGGVALDPVRVGSRPMGGRLGIGAHQGSTVLFKPVEVTTR